MARIETGNRIEGAVNFPRESTITLSAIQMRTLNATPRTLIPAPGAGRYIDLERVHVHKAVGTAFGSVATGDDLEYRYTDESGEEIMDTETVGFLDQATAETRITHNDTGSKEPVVNAPVVVAAGGALTGGRAVTFHTVYSIVEVGN